MSQSAAAASPWIVGPRYDLTFFSTAWLPPLLVLAAAGFAGLGLGVGFFFLWIYHLFIRLPHFGAMFHATYLREGQLPHYREHWLRYFAGPVLILVVYALPLLGPDGYASPPGFVLTTVAYCWGYQHIGMQNYGVLQLYRMRAGAERDLSGRRLEKGIFYAIIASVCLANHLGPVVRFASGRGLSSASVDAAHFGFLGLAALLTGAYFVRFARGGGLRLPAVLFFAVSVLAMVKWPFYQDLPRGSWFLVFNGHHSVAYLGLLFLMRWNERHPERPLTLGAGVSEYLRFFGPLVLFALVLILAASLYHSARVGAGYAEVGEGSLELLLGFFVVHYYVEAQVWRFRHRHHRETTLPLLRAPATQG